MWLLVPLLAAVQLVCGASIPDPSIHSYAFYSADDPQPNDAQISQFHFSSLDDGRYNWGYLFPGRVHQESKDTEGIVTGSVGYVDPRGDPVRYRYTAHPESGFVISDKSDETENVFIYTGEEAGVNPFEETPIDSPVVSVGEEGPENSVGSVPVMLIGLDQPFAVFKSEGQVIPSSSLSLSVGNEISDELLAREPVILIAQSDSPASLKSSVIDGLQGHFFVDPSIVEDAGGLSALAVKLGARPVAAVHNNRGAQQPC